MTRNRSLVGALIVHSGVAVAACAIAASAFADRTEVTLAAGQQITFEGYVIRYEGLRPRPEPQRMVLQAPVSVTSGGRSQGVMEPALNLYPAAAEPIPTPSIRFGAMSDLYISVLGFDNQGGRATFRILLNPGVTWLWVGGGLMALGGVIAYWPRLVRAAVTRAERAPRLAEAR